MKLLLLKTLLQRRERDEGFTLPMVIALGLVMLLLGTVNIVKSSEENIAAINTNSSSDALAIAEIGVARYRELLNQNRILTIYNHDQWDTNPNIVGADLAVTSDDRTCDDMTTAPQDSAGSPIWTGTATKPNDTAATATDASTTDNDNWWNITEDLDGDGTPELVGQYRLVSYQYDIDDDDFDSSTAATNNDGQFAPDDDNANTTDDFTFNDITYNPSGVVGTSNSPEGYNPTGILTVQGRSTDGSEAQIQVDIPLRINDLDNFAPVLWVRSGTIANPGNLNIASGDNIVLSGNGNNNCDKPSDISGNNVIRDPRTFPAIIDDPSGTPGIPVARKNGIDNGIASITVTPPAGLPAGTSPPPYYLPRNQSPQDRKTSSDDDGRFLYEVTTVDITDRDVLTDGDAKVTLYVSSDINITSSTRDVNVGNFDNSTSNVSSYNLEIYGSSASTTQAINIDTGSSNTVNIEAFIHAPNATLNVQGSGTLNINGAVWVNAFNNATAEVNITGDLTDTTTSSESSYKFYTTSATRTPRPLTSNPTNWVREEVE